MAQPFMNFWGKKRYFSKKSATSNEFSRKKKDYMENGEISYELLMKGQNLVTKLIVILDYNLIQYLFIRGEFCYNLIQYLFIRGEFWQIYH